MKLEAITVCINYSDFLEAVIPYNLNCFDRWLVVTKSSDSKTRWLCRKYNLDILLIDNKEDFAKGHFIERGLQHLSADGWRIHIDADIVLPRNTRQLLEMADLQEDTIYGCDRIMVKSYEDWLKLKVSNYLETQYAYNFALNFPEGFNVGTRWVGKNIGWCPIGFFQLWHSSQDLWSGIRVKPYPQNHNTACRTDVQHSLQWDRRKRILIPELVVVHLESEKCKTGANWNGRTTKQFGQPTTESNVSSVS